MYKALTFLNIPPNNRKRPGDKISKKEFEDADPPQTKEDIQALLDQGAISEDMDAPIDKAHEPVKVEGVPENYNVVADEFSEGSDSS